MIGYKTLRVCRLCKKRFVVEKGQKHNYYCKECLKKLEKDVD